jgi:hypothetical protein
MTTPTPTLFRDLRDLLKLWQDIEAGKNPVWNVLISAHTPVPTHVLRQHLGNVETANAKIYAWLRTLRKYNLITTTVTDGARHEINHNAKQAVDDFLRGFQISQGINPANLDFTARFISEQCHVLANARNFALWEVVCDSDRLWADLSETPMYSGTAAELVNNSTYQAVAGFKKLKCTLSQASTALRLLERVGLAKSVSRGRFQIYSGLEVRFLEDAAELVTAGIINVKD